MIILLVGSGGREHAIARAIKNSPLTSKLFITPGNPGMQKLGECKNIPVDDIEGLCNLAKLIKANPNARNPRTNQIIYVPEKKKIRFRPSKKLKEIVNKWNQKFS